MRGRGEAAESPSLQRGTAYEHRGGALHHLSDPTGEVEDGTNALTGSPWPAFAKSFHERTGRPAVYVVEAREASAQHPTAGQGNGHWRPDGDLLTLALADLDECLRDVATASVSATLEGVLWGQGERDAAAIDDGEVSRAGYVSAFNQMVAAMRTEVDRPELPVFLFQTGSLESGDTRGFRTIRDAQRDIVETDSNSQMVFSGAVEFPDEGEMQDEVHYTQEGYNEMGRVGGRKTAQFVT